MYKYKWSIFRFGVSVRPCLQISIVEVVHTHETILSTRSIAFAGGMHCNPRFIKKQVRGKGI